MRKSDISRYSGIVVGLVIGVLGVFFITNHLMMNDAFWHIKAGEWVSQYGILRKCYGSWCLSEENWMAHEWLFGWLLYLISRIGMDWIVIVYGILYIVTVLLCGYQAGMWKQKDTHPMLYMETVLLFQFCVYAMQMTARPQYLTAILIILFLIILEKSLNGKEKLLYLLPVIGVIWSNIHGGTSLLSYMMILVYLSCHLFQWSIGKIVFQKASKKWLITCCITLIMTVLALMINPYGYQMLIYPFANMKDTVMVSMIAEWAAPDAKNMVVLVLQILPMLLGIVALIQYQGKIKAHDVAMFFMFLILYLRSARFYPFLVVVQTSLIFPYAFRIVTARPQKAVMERKNVYRTINNLLLLGIGGFCIAYMGVAIVTASYDKIERNQELPEELLEIVLSDQPKRICNHYNIGGYLLYHGIDVFVDGRYEPYKQKDVIEDYLTITNPEKMEDYNKIDELIEKYAFDGFLLSVKNVPTIIYLEEHSEMYKQQYADEEWIYYKRK